MGMPSQPNINNVLSDLWMGWDTHKCERSFVQQQRQRVVGQVGVQREVRLQRGRQRRGAQAHAARYAHATRRQLQRGQRLRLQQ